MKYSMKRLPIVGFAVTYLNDRYFIVNYEQIKCKNSTFSRSCHQNTVVGDDDNEALQGCLIDYVAKNS